jgi:hypothetical protein
VTPGDQIVVLHEPWKYGVGTILHITRDGRLLVEFEPAVDTPGPFVTRKVFDAHEVELVSIWMLTA